MDKSNMDIAALRGLIRDVKDYPKPGIVFKDIAPLLAAPGALTFCAKAMAEQVAASGAEELVAIDARGFIFGAAISALTQMPLQIVRKPGKLPHEKVGLDYELEYGSDRVEMHQDAIVKDRRYALIDDLLATGGTAHAAVQLIQGQGGVVSGSFFLIELGFLNGRKKLGCPVFALLDY